MNLVASEGLSSLSQQSSPARVSVGEAVASVVPSIPCPWSGGKSHSRQCGSAVTMARQCGSQGEVPVWTSRQTSGRCPDVFLGVASVGHLESEQEESGAGAGTGASAQDKLQTEGVAAAAATETKRDTNEIQFVFGENVLTSSGLSRIFPEKFSGNRNCVSCSSAPGILTSSGLSQIFYENCDRANGSMASANLMNFEVSKNSVLESGRRLGWEIRPHVCP